ncbi:MAG: hypothetical protein WBQ44_05335 [Rhodococcus sp. (in: high G+C Gram-positive bacteria)]
MTSDELTGTERLILLVLMAQADETSNTRLKELGPELKKDHRERLNRLRLIETDHNRKPMVHTLTDKGWAECARELKGNAPPRATPQARAMYSVLSGLQRYLDKEDLRLSHVFRADPPLEATEEKNDHGVASAAGPDAPIDARIRTTYAQVATRSGAWVTLKDIRAALPDVPKPKLDRALGEMYRSEDVSLIAEENQKTLTESVRTSSITIAGQPVHLIAIEG